MGTCAQGATFKNADFYYSRPGNADFRDTNLEGANIARAIFRAADLRGANLSNTRGQANFDRAKM